MANNRITWQNVNAPDFGDALTGVGLAGSMFDRAADSFATSMNALEADRKGRKNATAMDKALRIGSATEFDRALQQQGLAAFGINPEDATPEMLDFVQGRRGALMDAASDDVGLAQQNQNLTSAQWAQNRAEQLAPITDSRAAFQDQQDQYAFGRQKTVDQRTDADFMRSEATRQLQVQADQAAQQIAQTSATPEEAARKAMNLGQGPQMEAAVLAGLQSQDPNRYTPSAAVAGTAGLLPDFALANETIGSRERAMNMAVSMNPAMQLYMEGSSGSQGYTNPVNGMLERMRGRLDPGDEEGASMMRKSAGNLQGVYDSMTQKYPGVPPQIISQVIENNLKKSGIAWFSDDQLVPNKAKIEDELDQVNTPAKLKLLDTEINAFEREQLELKEYSEAVEQQMAIHEWAVTNNNPQRAAAALAQVQRLNQAMTPAVAAAPQLPTPAAVNPSAPLGGNPSWTPPPPTMTAVPAPPVATGPAPSTLRNRPVGPGPRTP